MSESTDGAGRSEQRRPSGPAARSGSAGPRKGRPQSAGKPAGEGGHKPQSRDARPARDGEKRLWTKEGKPARGDAHGRDRGGQASDRPLTEEELRARELRPVRTRHDDPELPDDVAPGELDKLARMELKTLTKENAEWVARHLAMAARLIEQDPALAHLHAMSAARRAGRIAIVRETLAITAYEVGDFALALRELRTFRRISGSNEEVPLMVDCERALGRPDRALELGRSIDRATLSVPSQVALAIAMSGARLDQGDTEAALAELEIAQLDPRTAFSWSADLFAAYATVLEDLGREDEAGKWYLLADRAQSALDPDGDDFVEIVEEEYRVESSGEEGTAPDAAT